MEYEHVARVDFDAGNTSLLPQAKTSLRSNITFAYANAMN